MFYTVIIILFVIVFTFIYIKFIKSKKEISADISCKKYKATPTNQIKRGLIIFKGCHDDNDVLFDVIMTPIKFCAKEIVKLEDVKIEDIGDC